MGLPLPVPEYHEHYLEMWVRLDPSLRIAAIDFNYYAGWCAEQGFPTPGNYRVEHATKKFVEWARENGVLHTTEFKEPSLFKKKDHRLLHMGETLLSIDMRKANFSVMKLAAVQHEKKMFDSWEELCRHLGINYFLAGPKTFRQLCFGGYEPKKVNELQRGLMAKLAEGICSYEDLVYIGHDEIVIPYSIENLKKARKAIADMLGPLSPLVFKLTAHRLDRIHDIRIRPTEDGAMEREMQFVRTEKDKVVAGQRYEQAAKFRDREREIQKKLDEHYLPQLTAPRPDSEVIAGCWMRTELDITHLDHDTLTTKKKILVGVPSNRFYRYLRTHLLREPLQDKDLVFLMDGRKARWLEDDKAQERPL